MLAAFSFFKSAQIKTFPLYVEIAFENFRYEKISVGSVFYTPRSAVDFGIFAFEAAGFETFPLSCGLDAEATHGDAMLGFLANTLRCSMNIRPASLTDCSFGRSL